MRKIYDPMEYQPNMQQIDSDIFDHVIAARTAYHPEQYTAKQVQAALQKDVLSFEDFAALLSPAAQPFLEQMARRAKEEREKHFGNNVLLFTPLYISNYCENQCVYCGFNCKNPITRCKLNAAEIEAEMENIAKPACERCCCSPVKAVLFPVRNTLRKLSALPRNISPRSDWKCTP